MDLGKIKQRQAQTKSSGDRFEVKEGPNHVRLYAFSHKVTESDVKNGFFTKEKLGKTERECDRAVTIHFGVGGENRPVLSNPALVKKYETVLAAQGEEAARKIGPQTKYAVNVVDTDEKPRKMRHWLAPKSVYNKILAKMGNEDYAKDGEFGELLLGSAGRDFTVTYNPSAKGALKYDVEVRDADKSPKMSTDLEEKARDFFSKDGFSALGILIQGGEQEEEEAVSEEEEKTEEDAEEKEGSDEAEEKEEEESEEKEETKATKAKGKKKEESKKSSKSKKSTKHTEEED